ncbi:hypothetical protein BSNK01_26370 [Bacillaceae bacterium]
MWLERLLGQPFANGKRALGIEKRVLSEAIAFAKQAYPAEWTALLAGKDTRITRLLPITNASKERSHSFRWQEDEFLRRLRQLYRWRLEWLGVIHSHPHSPPVPSRRDEENWHYHQLSYWIVSLRDGEAPVVALYRFKNETFVQCPYTIL